MEYLGESEDGVNPNFHLAESIYLFWWFSMPIEWLHKPGGVSTTSLEVEELRTVQSDKTAPIAPTRASGASNGTK